MSLTVWDGITVGAVGGILAGLTIWFVKLLKERIMKEWDKRTVYNWLYQRTKNYKDSEVDAYLIDPQWVLTPEIACYTNLTIERVRYLCSVHEKIRPFIIDDLLIRSGPLEEKWAIRSFVAVSYTHLTLPTILLV